MIAKFLIWFVSCALIGYLLGEAETVYKNSRENNSDELCARCRSLRQYRRILKENHESRERLGRLPIVPLPGGKNDQKN